MPGLTPRLFLFKEVIMKILLLISIFIATPVSAQEVKVTVNPEAPPPVRVYVSTEDGEVSTEPVVIPIEGTDLVITPREKVDEDSKP